MKSKLFFLTFLSLCIVFFGCEKDEATIDTQYQLADEKTIDQNIETLSKLLATSIYGNVELKLRIKEEIGYRFDHDYDALLLTFLGKEINGRAFEELLSESSNGRYKPSDIVKMIKESGYIHLSIPVHFDTFDPTRDELLVFPIASAVEEKVTEELEAFDHLGNIVRFPAKEAPKMPVLVIMRSERVDSEGYIRVNHSGILLPKKMRLHYIESIKNARIAKNQSIQHESIVKILSTEEYKKILKKSINTSNHFNNTITQKSANSDDIYLTCSTTSPYSISVVWNAYPGANRFELFRSGDVSVNGNRIRRDNLLIASLDNTYKHGDIVDYGNSPYLYYVKYYYGSTFLFESNQFQIQSSHRRDGGMEYISYIKATDTMVNDLEGWWCNMLELDFDINYINSSGVFCEKEPVGFNVSTLGSGPWNKYVEWSGKKNLFRWNHSNEDFSSYTITVSEDDGGDDKKDLDDVLVDWIRLITETALKSDGNTYGSIITEACNTLKKTISILRKSDPVGTLSIHWDYPNGDEWELHGKGFTIIVNHDSN